jgi:hypothetical protein
MAVIAYLPDSPESQTAEAIFRTVLYADVFHFPMTEAEIHHFLIGRAATRGEVHAALEHSVWLRTHLICSDGYYTLSPDGAALRRQREANSQRLWARAERYGRRLAHLPFVRMVALTGALAMRNPRHAHDDIDYLLVTTPSRVWLTRLLAVIVVRLARLRGVDLCPNFVLAETALQQDRQDLYMAHEVAQMIPLAGFELYYAMREVNAWADAYLPNAREPFYPTQDAAPKGIGRVLQRAAEAVLSTPLGNWLENWERRRKQRKFAAQSSGARSTARLDEDQVKGHFNDNGLWVMEKYQERLNAYRFTHAEREQADRYPVMAGEIFAVSDERVEER